MRAVCVGPHANAFRARTASRAIPLRLSRTEMLIAVCAMAVTLAVTLGTAAVPRPAVATSTVAVRVSANDTLWDIARAHPIPGTPTVETVAAIKRLNDMTDSSIAVGDVLRVPAPASARTALARR